MKTIKDFLSELGNQDIKLWVSNDAPTDANTTEEIRLRCNAPKGTLTSDIRTQIAERKAEIITFLQQGLDLNSQLEPISLVSRSENLPLSFAQARLWFLSQLEGETATYHMSEPLRISGSLNVTALEMAVQEIVRRHEVLRTNFKIVNGSPVQVIANAINVTMPVVDLQQLSEDLQSAQVQQLASDEASKPFDLANDSLLRVTLLRLGEQSHVLLLTMHHIISDGWSMGIFIQELSTLYQTFDTGKPSELPELSIQYADFAHWQRQWLSGKELETQLNYWKQQLANIPPLLELPTDRPRPSIQTYQGSTEYLQLGQQLALKLKNLSQKSGATLFMTLLAAFSTLMYRYSGQSDIVVGSPIANRNRNEIEPLIGFFVNTLVLRTQIQGNPTFLELLEQVREMTLGAYTHQDLPFEKLGEELQPQRSLSYSPLFQVMFVLQNASVGELELPGLSIAPLEVENVVAKFDLTLSIEETQSGLQCAWEYNTDLFDAATMSRMAQHFQVLLEAIVANPQQRVAQLPLLSDFEHNQLLFDWNNTASEFERDKCIHQLFELIVEQNPDAIALVFENQQLTYRELNARANQLAHHLQSLGVQPEMLVGIYVERSLEMIIGLLGILKAGGAYVPLDPAYPQERLSLILSDSQVSLLLTQQKLVASLQSQVMNLVCLDTDWEVISQQSQVNPNSGLQASNLAYVIYTSGSTGKPKGALLAHQGLCNLALEHIRMFNIESNSRVLQFASLNFDASISEIVMALCAGARLCLATKDSLLPGANLIELLQNQKITHATLPPSALAAMPSAELPDLQTIVVAGEACSIELIKQWSGGRNLINGYGPTESTVCATTHLYIDGDSKLPIGRPIANTQVYILDEHLQVVPIGVPGELHIGGVSLARGYLNREDLTQQKFIPNPFSQEYSARLYKTGDKARYLADGNIEFLGRIDYQVKIRGFRIELGEIEGVLAQHPQVQEAVVIAREDQPGNQHLVGYVVLTSEIATSTLRDYLKQKLPNYMVPSVVVSLESLPLNPNGKVDRRALPEPNIPLSLKANYVPPRDALELQLVQIWEQVLDIHPIGVRDNFFDLGGHSLLTISLMARIQQQFGRDLSLAALFQDPTIEQLASVLRTDAAQTCSTVVPLQSGGSKKPFFCVHPGQGTVLAYIDLANCLGLEQPFYGLESLGLHEENKPYSRVEDMATHYIEAMQTIQPQGPYLLGGWSFGGLVAFEMAQQLQAQGQQVAFLGLMDTYAIKITSEDDELPVDAAFLLDLLSEDDLPAEQPFLFERIQQLEPDEQLYHVIEYAKSANWIPLDFGLESARRLLQLFRSHFQAGKNYIPQPYSGKVTLFLASEEKIQDPTLGWGNLANEGVEIHWVPGNHQSIVSKPDVLVLAEQLRVCLEKSQVNN